MNKIQLSAYTGRDAQMISSFLQQCESAGITEIMPAMVILDKRVTEKALKHRMSIEAKELARIKQQQRKERIEERNHKNFGTCPECGDRNMLLGRKLNGILIDWCKNCSYSRVVG